MTNKTVLVTGASRGIGYQTALHLAQNSYRVLATARSADKLRELASRNDLITGVACDLLENTSMEILAQTIRDNDIVITSLVHNAGGLVNKPFTELSDDDWNLMWNTNVMSGVRLLRTLLPYFEQNAHIVTIGSMGGFQGSEKFPGLSAYSTSKGALSIWTECMATELKQKSISVNCLCLGAVETEMLQNAFPGIKAPLKASQIARFIADFALNGHRYMNGKILPVALSNP